MRENLTEFIKSIVSTLKGLVHLHKYSKDIIHGSLQFSIVLYAFAGFIYLIAPYTPDYILSVSYYTAALEVAPVILAGGVVAALLCDLALRKNKTEEPTDEQDKKD